MTSITYVTPKEMERRTGFQHALGYATSDGNILIRKGLPKKLERKVKRHEEDHVRKGEEGPFIGAIVGSLVSGILGSRSADRAAQAQTDANQAAIDEQRRQFNTILDLTGPGRQIGNQALNAIASLLGLEGATPTASPANIGARPANDELLAARAVAERFGIDPSQFSMPDTASTPTMTTQQGAGGFDAASLLERGFPGSETITSDTIRRIRQSGAASGSAGGNVLTELADRISGFQNDRLFGSLFQLAGFGPQATSTAAGGAGNAAANIGSLLQSSGVANASGVLGAGQSQNAALQNVLQLLTLRGGSGGQGLFNAPGPNGLSTINTNAIRDLRI